jgi:hypothetical protein
LAFDGWTALTFERLAFVVVVGDVDDEARRVLEMPPVGRDPSPAPRELRARCFFALWVLPFAPFAPAAVAEAVPAAVVAIRPAMRRANALGSPLGSFVAASAFPVTAVVEAPGVLAVGVVP